MLLNCFYWLLNMSITATVAGGIVIILRMIKRIPRKVIMVLWTAPFLRLLIPFGLRFKFSLMNLVPDEFVRTVEVESYNSKIDLVCANSLRVAGSYHPISLPADVETIFYSLAYLWLIGFIVFVTGVVLSYRAVMREAGCSELYKDNLYCSEKAKSPYVYGIVHPKIILPDSDKGKNIEYIIRHESMHIRRRDNLRRLLCTIIVCVHWFNPFAWLFLRKFYIDLELSCDESVVKGLNMTERKAYANALVTYTERPAMLSSTFGGAPLKMRVERIISYKRHSKVAMSAFYVIASFVVVTLLTNSISI
ncbi:MAG: M56 family metallopeptidase [Lachnospiraceae bacterium]|nr:M56 family metallopeptidase [Lachnospiraceae bacterium]